MLAMFICNVVDIKVLKLNNEPWEFLQQQETHTCQRLFEGSSLGAPLFFEEKTRWRNRGTTLKNMSHHFLLRFESLPRQISWICLR